MTQPTARQSLCRNKQDSLPTALVSPPADASVKLQRGWFHGARVTAHIRDAWAGAATSGALRRGFSIFARRSQVVVRYPTVTWSSGVTDVGFTRQTHPFSGVPLSLTRRNRAPGIRPSSGLRLKDWLALQAYSESCPERCRRRSSNLHSRHDYFHLDLRHRELQAAFR
jgi:hypothetical protein